MATDPERARSTASIAAIIAIAVVFLLFLVIIFRGCHQEGPGADTINPNEPLPGAQPSTGWAPELEGAVPLLV